MAHRPRKGGNSARDVDIGRREALTRLGLGVTVASAAPVLLTLTSAAQAGVVIGDGDLDNHNDKGGSGGGASGQGTGNGHGGHIGQNRRRKPEGGGDRISVQELLEYLANFGKAKKK
jgi:hypothetical protein